MGCCCSSLCKSTDAMGNSLSSKPTEKQKRAQRLDRSAKTGILSLQGAKLKTIPPGTFKNAAIRNLDLSVNALVHVPALLLNLKMLRSLNLSQNALGSKSLKAKNGSAVPALPPDLRPLAKLQRLALDRNALAAIPLLPRGLQRLTASNNRLAAWPAAVDACGKLRELDLSGNRLTLLDLAPDHALQQLERLSLDDNTIAALPPSLGRCSKLQNLSAQRNRISLVPPQIFSDTAVDRLNLRGNPGLTREGVGKMPGFAAFQARRKRRIDKEIRSGMDVTDHTALCGLDTDR
jgi:Leucine-rich repeat (LRR) protein